ncbi:hypothetical protein EVAR_19677_1 [Eumeta japonica]|uniref:RNase H type-1 domain-containing protein n=1 Tax=Eumeta variegata TaxID=151549 RepID=A0A4C1V3M6_EUMVA|nr:hypothetical protein EVAR_19677_1 [Eumeta japonica]
MLVGRETREGLGKSLEGDGGRTKEHEIKMWFRPSIPHSLTDEFLIRNLARRTSNYLNYVVLGVECTNSDTFFFKELRSIIEDGVPLKPTVLYYTAEEGGTFLYSYGFGSIECHPVPEVNVELYQRLIKAGYVYAGLQRRSAWDQSPLVQCPCCLGYEHCKRFCKDVSERCARCGGEHTGLSYRARKKGESPKCINCIKVGSEDTAHGAFSTKCGVRAKWDGSVKGNVLLAEGTLAAVNRTRMAEGSPTEGCTDHIRYESDENLDSQTLDCIAAVESHIYTDRSRIESKVGAALVEWRDRQETWYSTLRFDAFCTVFQAKIFALQRTIRRVKKSKDWLVNVFSDSRSVLEVFIGPKTSHSLVDEARRDIFRVIIDIKAGLCVYSGLECMPK